MMVQASPLGASWLYDTGVCLSFRAEQGEGPDKSA